VSEMSFKEAASELGISEEELEKLVASNEIASTKDGDSLLFTKEAIDNYKNQGEAEIILSDDDLDILGDDEDEIDFGIDLTGGDAETDDGSSPDVADIAAEDDAGGSVGDETVLDIGSLLDDDDDSEGTTPIPGAEDSGDEGGLGDETLLDTDILDLGDDDADTFELDTTEDTLLDPTEEGSLLRGGGARVMQMKRRKSHAPWTVLLSFAGLVLLIPLAVLLGTVHNEGLTVGRGEFTQAQERHPQTWIKEWGGYFDFVHDLAEMFRK